MFFGLSIIILIALGVLLWRPIYDQLNRWELIPRPETLTELYFTAPTHVPSAYTPAKTQVVNFTLHNLEAKSVTYTYTITEQAADGSSDQLLATGKLALTNGHYATVSKAVKPVFLGARVKIIVALSTGESIYYWVNRE